MKRNLKWLIAAVPALLIAQSLQAAQITSYEREGFRGRAFTTTGRVDNFMRNGFNDRVTSVRIAERRRNDSIDAPPPGVARYEYRRRPNERLYEVPVSSARAVYGPPQQRCWIESQQVEERGRANVGGAVAGGAIGANAGRDRGTTYRRDVEHCSARESGPPEYWDVRYEFRGEPHTVQMSEPPGRTILVNRNGEPRQ